MGKQEEVKTFCAYLDGETSIEARVKEFMENIKEGEEWVIVTDLLGGSVNNEFMKYIHRPDVHFAPDVREQMRPVHRVCHF